MGRDRNCIATIAHELAHIFAATRQVAGQMYMKNKRRKLGNWFKNGDLIKNIGGIKSIEK